VLKEKEYIQMSLELNLFFGRIMKEHMIIMEMAFLVRNSNLILEADQLKSSFEEMLLETLMLSNGAISKEVIDSNELVTPYTLDAEISAEALTGICINRDITLAELKLTSNPDFNCPLNLEKYVFQLNNRFINLVKEIIAFKEKVLSQLLNCTIHAALYPLLVEHTLREAKLYLKYLIKLQEQMESNNDILKQEVFWDIVMEQHSLFIRGLLDPTEKELFKTADDFANIFEELAEKTKEASKEDIPKITEETQKAVIEIKAFKTAGTRGLLDCKIKSMLTALLGDHVLREANHFNRLLNSFRKGC
jgi:hypothetical protein